MERDVLGALTKEHLSPYRRNVPESFEIGFAAQKDWKTWEVLAFYLGGVGAGLYVVAQFLHLTTGLIVGYVLVVFGKNLAHLLASSKPERSLRAFSNPRTSWISRGAFFIALFTLFGGVDIALRLGWMGGGWHIIWKGVALLCAFVFALLIMLYVGFVMAQSRIIPLWHSSLLPVTLLTYSLALGAALGAVLFSLRGGDNKAGLLNQILFISTALTMLLILLQVLLLKGSSKTARISVEMLIKGGLRGMFVGGVLILGLCVPILLTAYTYFVGESQKYLILPAGLLTLFGGFLFESALLKAGIYCPLLDVK